MPWQGSEEVSVRHIVLETSHLHTLTAPCRQHLPWEVESQVSARQQLPTLLHLCSYLDYSDFSQLLPKQNLSFILLPALPAPDGETGWEAEAGKNGRHSKGMDKRTFEAISKRERELLL